MSRLSVRPREPSPKKPTPHAGRRLLRAEPVALAAIVALAAALRLVDLGAVRLDPFYDAAVRSMGRSWHNFFFGAYEPGGSVAIDKPPVDLWLQVASVKLLGWGSFSLKLPQALAGTAAVPLLYAALRRTFGAVAALAAAAALAVMPIEAITARSDTMDAVMMALLVAALLALMRACEQSPARRRATAGWLLLGAAAMGAAFNVKLLESLVALPGLVVLLWLARGPLSRSARLGAPRRAVAFAAGALAAAYVLVSLSWLLATLAFPAHERPWAIGSSNGSAWNAAFVFNGSERLSGKAVEVGQSARSGSGAGGGPAPPIAPPSPTRLLARSGQLPARWLGWQALAALLLGSPALIAAWRRRRERPLAWASAGGLFVWLVTGLVLFSAMTRLHPRYVEAFTPAVAAMFGLGVGWLASLLGSPGLAWARPVARSALPLALLGASLALLAVSAAVSVQAVRAHTSDAGNVGALEPHELRALSAYLRAHQGSARYEVAAGAATSVASLIVHDEQPVLMLTTYAGRPFTSVARLRALVAQGQVRYAFLDSACGRRSARDSAARGSAPAASGCAPAARWVRAHGTDVSSRAGLPRAGLLWRLA